EVEALALDENSRAAHAALGAVDEAHGRPIEAAEHYAIVMEAARDDETALRAGRAAARLFAAAAPAPPAGAPERGVAGAPRDGAARSALLSYYMQAADERLPSDPARARAALERALELEGGAPDGRTQLRVARLWQSLGERELAQARFRAALEAAPEMLEVREL